MPPRRLPGAGAEEDSAEARVYVNNMNTARPTVTIPTRTKTTGRTAVAGFKKERDGDAAGEADGAPVSVVNTDATHRAAGAATVSYSNHATGTVVLAAPPTVTSAAPPVVSISSEDNQLHPNLEQVYARVMRRLQRQLNYEELNRTPLVEQYGLTTALAGEDVRASVSVIASESASAVATANSSDAGTRHRLNNSVYSSPSSVPRRTASPQKVGGGGDIAGGEGGTGGTLVRYGRRQNTSGRTATSHQTGAAPLTATAGTDMLSHTASNDLAGMDTFERAFAAQPCPPTLRLVVQHVQETLTNKMAMAERSTLKECLRLTFESRALLDRLLKEVPSYASFPADPEAVPVRAAAGVGARLQELYQGFRRAPVLIPRAQFVQDLATGTLRAELDFAQQAALGQAPPGTEASPLASAVVRPSTAAPLPQPAPPPRNSIGKLASLASGVVLQGGRGSGSGGGAEGGGGGAGSGVEKQDVVLPASYGRSARLLRGDGAASSGHEPVGGGQPQSPGSTSLPRVSSLQPSLPGGPGTGLPALPSPSASIDATATLGLDGVGSTTQHPLSGRLAGGRGGGVGHGSSGGSSTLGIGAAAAKVSVATLTEECAGTTVSPEAYAELQDYAARLEVELAEARSTHAGLAERLVEESNYVDSRRRIVAYLRETLLRECNMLRTSLQLASQREQQLQQNLKDRHGNGGKGLGGGGGLGGFGGLTDGGGGLGGLRANASFALTRAKQSGRPTQGPVSMESSCSQLAVSGAGGGAGRSFVGRFASPTAAALGGGGGASGPHQLSISGASPTSAAEAGNSLPCNNASDPGAGGPAAAAANDLTSIQSLLDLALLAVESDSTFTVGLDAVGALGTDLVRQTMTKDAKHQADALRAKFEEKNRRLQESIMTQKIRGNFVVAAKDREIAQLRKLADMSYVKQTLYASIGNLRSEQRKLEHQIREQLRSFQIMMNATASSVVNRSRLMDKTVSDNAFLQNTLDATTELVECVNSLFLPMLTLEYTRGYHPWPAKLRNSIDPFSHIIQSRYGPTEAVRLREQINTLSEVYVAIHRYVAQQAVMPDQARPTVGAPLRMLCARLALSPISNTEVIFEVRQRYDRELRLQRAIARLNFRLLHNVHLQRAYTERSVGAIAFAGMDPYTTTLPVSRRVNELAAARGALTHERNMLQKERLENAKQVYRTWRERGIDIYEGFSAPSVTGAKLAVLSDAALVRPAGGGVGGGPIGRGPRNPSVANSSFGFLDAGDTSGGGGGGGGGGGAELGRRGTTTNTAANRRSPAPSLSLGGGLSAERASTQELAPPAH